MIDQDELDADMEEFVVLATCLHNDRTMHMVDPRLAAAAQEDGLGGPGDSAAEIDEGDEPPYDLVPYNKVRHCCYHVIQEALLEVLYTAVALVVCSDEVLPLFCGTAQPVLGDIPHGTCVQ